MDQGAADNASYLVTAFLAGDVGKYTELQEDIPAIGQPRGVKPGGQGISTTTFDPGASEPVPALVRLLAGVAQAVLSEAVMYAGGESGGMRHVSVARLPASSQVRHALREFLERARTSAPAMGRIVVYGSIARGEGGPSSDVDLFIQWDGDGWSGRRVLRPIANDIWIRTGVPIALHIVSPSHLERLQRANTRFLRNVEREGLIVET